MKKSPSFTQMDTPRLVLRSFQERDIDAFSRYRSDPEVARYQGWETPYSMEQAAHFVDAMSAAEPGKPGHYYQIAIELKSTGEIIGDCVFIRLREDKRQAEIGFTLARTYQGQGYAREAVAKLIDYLFAGLGLHRIRANCDPQNSPSARLLEKVGMRHEGRFIESLWMKGCWVDEDWYAILRKEWQVRQIQASSE